MSKAISKKMGIRQDVRAVFIHAPKDALKAMDPPDLNVASRMTGNFDYIHFFANKKTDLRKKFPKLKDHLKETGMLWVSWPKARQRGTDLTLPMIIKIGYDYGLSKAKR